MHSGPASGGTGTGWVSSPMQMHPTRSSPLSPPPPSSAQVFKSPLARAADSSAFRAATQGGGSHPQGGGGHGSQLHGATALAASSHAPHPALTSTMQGPPPPASVTQAQMDGYALWQRKALQQQQQFTQIQQQQQMQSSNAAAAAAAQFSSPPPPHAAVPSVAYHEPAYATAASPHTGRLFSLSPSPSPAHLPPQHRAYSPGAVSPSTAAEYRSPPPPLYLHPHGGGSGGGSGHPPPQPLQLHWTSPPASSIPVTQASPRPFQLSMGSDPPTSSFAAHIHGASASSLSLSPAMHGGMGGSHFFGHAPTPPPAPYPGPGGGARPRSASGVSQQGRASSLYAGGISGSHSFSSGAGSSSYGVPLDRTSTSVSSAAASPRSRTLSPAQHSAMMLDAEFGGGARSRTGSWSLNSPPPVPVQRTSPRLNSMQQQQHASYGQQQHPQQQQHPHSHLHLSHLPALQPGSQHYLQQQPQQRSPLTGLSSPGSGMDSSSSSFASSPVSTPGSSRRGSTRFDAPASGSVSAASVPRPPPAARAASASSVSPMLAHRQLVLSPQQQAAAEAYAAAQLNPAGLSPHQIAFQQQQIAYELFLQSHAAAATATHNTPALLRSQSERAQSERTSPVPHTESLQQQQQQRRPRTPHARPPSAQQAPAPQSWLWPQHRPHQQRHSNNHHQQPQQQQQQQYPAVYASRPFVHHRSNSSSSDGGGGGGVVSWAPVAPTAYTKAVAALSAFAAPSATSSTAAAAVLSPMAASPHFHAKHPPPPLSFPQTQQYQSQEQEQQQQQPLAEAQPMPEATRPQPIQTEEKEDGSSSAASAATASSALASTPTSWSHRTSMYGISLPPSFRAAKHRMLTAAERKARKRRALTEKEAEAREQVRAFLNVPGLTVVQAAPSPDSGANDTSDLEALQAALNPTEEEMGSKHDGAPPVATSVAAVAVAAASSVAAPAVKVLTPQDEVATRELRVKLMDPAHQKVFAIPEGQSLDVSEAGVDAVIAAGGGASHALRQVVQMEVHQVKFENAAQLTQAVHVLSLPLTLIDMDAAADEIYITPLGGGGLSGGASAQRALGAKELLSMPKSAREYVVNRSKVQNLMTTVLLQHEEQQVLVEAAEAAEAKSRRGSRPASRMIQRFEVDEGDMEMDGDESDHNDGPGGLHRSRRRGAAQAQTMTMLDFETGTADGGDELDHAQLFVESEARAFQELKARLGPRSHRPLFHTHIDQLAYSNEEAYLDDLAQRIQEAFPASKQSALRHVMQMQLEPNLEFQDLDQVVKALTILQANEAPQGPMGSGSTRNNSRRNSQHSSIAAAASGTAAGSSEPKVSSAAAVAAANAVHNGLALDFVTSLAAEAGTEHATSPQASSRRTAAGKQSHRAQTIQLLEQEVVESGFSQLVQEYVLNHSKVLLEMAWVDEEAQAKMEAQEQHQHSHALVVSQSLHHGGTAHLASQHPPPLHRPKSFHVQHASFTDGGHDFVVEEVGGAVSNAAEESWEVEEFGASQENQENVEANTASGTGESQQQSQAERIQDSVARKQVLHKLCDSGHNALFSTPHVVMSPSEVASMLDPHSGGARPIDALKHLISFELERIQFANPNQLVRAVKTLALPLVAENYTIEDVAQEIEKAQLPPLAQSYVMKHSIVQLEIAKVELPIVTVDKSKQLRSGKKAKRLRTNVVQLAAIDGSHMHAEMVTTVASSDLVMQNHDHSRNHHKRQPSALPGAHTQVARTVQLSSVHGYAGAGDLGDSMEMTMEEVDTTQDSASAVVTTTQPVKQKSAATLDAEAKEEAAADADRTEAAKRASEAFLRSALKRRLSSQATPLFGGAREMVWSDEDIEALVVMGGHSAEAVLQHILTMELVPDLSFETPAQFIRTVQLLHMKPVPEEEANAEEAAMLEEEEAELMELAADADDADAEQKAAGGDAGEATEQTAGGLSLVVDPLAASSVAANPSAALSPTHFSDPRSGGPSAAVSPRSHRPSRRGRSVRGQELTLLDPDEQLANDLEWQEMQVAGLPKQAQAYLMQHFQVELQLAKVTRAAQAVPGGGSSSGSGSGSGSGMSHVGGSRSGASSKAGSKHGSMRNVLAARRSMKLLHGGSEHGDENMMVELVDWAASPSSAAAAGAPSDPKPAATAAVHPAPQPIGTSIPPSMTDSMRRRKANFLTNVRAKSLHITQEEHPEELMMLAAEARAAAGDNTPVQHSAPATAAAGGAAVRPAFPSPQPSPLNSRHLPPPLLPSSHVSAAHVDAIFDQSGAGPKTMNYLHELLASGRSFENTEGLIAAVREMHEAFLERDVKAREELHQRLHASPNPLLVHPSGEAVAADGSSASSSDPFDSPGMHISDVSHLIELAGGASEALSHLNRLQAASVKFENPLAMRAAFQMLTLPIEMVDLNEVRLELSQSTQQSPAAVSYILTHLQQRIDDHEAAQEMMMTNTSGGSGAGSGQGAGAKNDARTINLISMDDSFEFQPELIGSSSRSSLLTSSTTAGRSRISSPAHATDLVRAAVGAVGGSHSRHPSNGIGLAAMRSPAHSRTPSMLRGQLVGKGPTPGLGGQRGSLMQPAAGLTSAAAAGGTNSLTNSLNLGSPVPVHPATYLLLGNAPPSFNGSAAHSPQESKSNSPMHPRSPVLHARNGPPMLVRAASTSHATLRHSPQSHSALSPTASSHPSTHPSPAEGSVSSGGAAASLASNDNDEPFQTARLGASANNNAENGPSGSPLSPGSPTAFPNTPLRRLRKKGKSVAFSHEEVLHLAPRAAHPGRLHGRSNSMGDGAIMGNIMNLARERGGAVTATNSGASSPRHHNPSSSLRSSLRPNHLPELHAIPDSPMRAVSIGSPKTTAGVGSLDLDTLSSSQHMQHVLSPISASLQILQSSAVVSPTNAGLGGGVGSGGGGGCSTGAARPKRRGKSVFFSEDVLAFSPILPLSHSAHSSISHMQSITHSKDAGSTSMTPSMISPESLNADGTAMSFADGFNAAQERMEQDELVKLAQQQQAIEQQQLHQEQQQHQEHQKAASPTTSAASTVTIHPHSHPHTPPQLASPLAAPATHVPLSPPPLASRGSIVIKSPRMSLSLPQRYGGLQQQQEEKEASSGLNKPPFTSQDSTAAAKVVAAADDGHAAEDDEEENELVASLKAAMSHGRDKSLHLDSIVSHQSLTPRMPSPKLSPSGSTTLLKSSGDMPPPLASITTKSASMPPRSSSADTPDTPLSAPSGSPIAQTPSSPSETSESPASSAHQVPSRSTSPTARNSLPTPTNSATGSLSDAPPEPLRLFRNATAQPQSSSTQAATPTQTQGRPLTITAAIPTVAAAPATAGSVAATPSATAASTPVSVGIAARRPKESVRVPLTLEKPAARPRADSGASPLAAGSESAGPPTTPTPTQRFRKSVRAASASYAAPTTAYMRKITVAAMANAANANAAAPDPPNSANSSSAGSTLNTGSAAFGSSSGLGSWKASKAADSTPSTRKVNITRGRTGSTLDKPTASSMLKQGPGDGAPAVTATAASRSPVAGSTLRIAAGMNRNKSRDTLGTGPSAGGLHQRSTSSAVTPTAYLSAAALHERKLSAQLSLPNGPLSSGVSPTAGGGGGARGHHLSLSLSSIESQDMDDSFTASAAAVAAAGGNTSTHAPSRSVSIEESGLSPSVRRRRMSADHSASSPVNRDRRGGGAADGSGLESPSQSRSAFVIQVDGATSPNRSNRRGSGGPLSVTTGRRSDSGDMDMDGGLSSIRSHSAFGAAGNSLGVHGRQDSLEDDGTAGSRPRALSTPAPPPVSIFSLSRMQLEDSDKPKTADTYNISSLLPATTNSAASAAATAAAQAGRRKIPERKVVSNVDAWLTERSFDPKVREALRGFTFAQLYKFDQGDLVDLLGGVDGANVWGKLRTEPPAKNKAASSKPAFGRQLSAERDASDEESASASDVPERGEDAAAARRRHTRKLVQRRKIELRIQREDVAAKAAAEKARLDQAKAAAKEEALLEAEHARLSQQTQDFLLARRQAALDSEKEHQAALWSEIRSAAEAEDAVRRKKQEEEDEIRRIQRRNHLKPTLAAATKLTNLSFDPMAGASSAALAAAGLASAATDDTDMDDPEMAAATAAANGGAASDAASSALNPLAVQSAQDFINFERAKREEMHAKAALRRAEVESLRKLLLEERDEAFQTRLDSVRHKRRTEMEREQLELFRAREKKEAHRVAVMQTLREGIETELQEKRREIDARIAAAQSRAFATESAKQEALDEIRSAHDHDVARRLSEHALRVDRHRLEKSREKSLLLKKAAALKKLYNEEASEEIKLMVALRDEARERASKIATALPYTPKVAADYSQKLAALNAQLDAEAAAGK